MGVKKRYWRQKERGEMEQGEGEGMEEGAVQQQPHWQQPVGKGEEQLQQLVRLLPLSAQLLL